MAERFVPERPAAVEVCPAQLIEGGEIRSGEDRMGRPAELPVVAGSKQPKLASGEAAWLNGEYADPVDGGGGIIQ